MWVDVYEAARTGRSLQGSLQMIECPRVLALREVPTPVQAELLGEDARMSGIDWAARFYQVQATGQASQSWMALRFSTRLLQKCVRCLEPVVVEIAQERSFVFVGSEERAAELDEDLEDADVLVGSRRFDLAELIEDELILALPALPQHESCDLPAQARQRRIIEEARDKRPFDLLKAVDWGKSGGKH